MFKNYLTIINTILILGFGIYVIFTNRAVERRGYVLNQQVFDGFQGKKELEQKLMQLKNDHQVVLDSLTLLIQRQPGNAALADHYKNALQDFELRQQELSQRYTADIWKRINRYLLEYGKSHQYTFIFGASGDGGLMYADEDSNITEEIIQYINKRYREGD